VYSKKAGFVALAAILAVILFSVVAGAYQTIAHRYITCKALEGLRNPLPEAHAEFRQYANCTDCTIFKGTDCLGLTIEPPMTSQALVHANRDVEWGKINFCLGLDGPVYQPPGQIVMQENSIDYTVDYEGDDLVTGSSAEDAVNVTDPRSGLRTPAFASHFWDPDIHFSAVPGDFDGGLSVSVRVSCVSAKTTNCRIRQSSYHRAQGLWATAVSLYRDGKTREAYYVLGRIAHLLEDLTVPAHVHGDNHNGDKKSKPFLHTCCGGKRHGDSRVDTVETYTADKAVLQGMDRKKVRAYKDEKLLSDDIWESLDADQKGRLFKLFWFTAQKTQYWASNGDQNPDGPDPDEVQCSEDIPDASTICDEYAFGTLGKPNIYFDKDGNTGFLPLDLWSSTNSPLTLPCRINTSTPGEQERMAKALLGHALSAVSGLYRLFWDQTHDADGDGYGIVTDCDDANPQRFPGNPEVCTDAIDNNCDGVVNENCPSFILTHYPRSDSHPHFLADMQMATSSTSTATRISVVPVGGFVGDVTIRVISIFYDTLPVNPDGTYGDGLPDELFSDTPSTVIIPVFDGLNRSSRVVPAGSSTLFAVTKRNIRPGRYIIKLQGTAGEITVEQFVLLVIGADTPGYIEQ
jgi:hypothetical protein